jgi:hypothetical protein
MISSIKKKETHSLKLKLIVHNQINWSLVKAFNYFTMISIPTIERSIIL